MSAEANFLKYEILLVIKESSDGTFSEDPKDWRIVEEAYYILHRINKVIDDHFKPIK